MGRYRDRDGDAPAVRAHFYGDRTADYDTAAESAGVTDCIETHGFVPHEAVIPELAGADALLYVGGTDPRNRLNVPSKMWDYLAAQRPILALVDPEFAAAEFVREHDVGVVAHPDEPTAIADAIEALATREFEYDPAPDLPERYSRERNADAFVDVLDEVSGT